MPKLKKMRIFTACMILLCSILTSCQIPKTYPTNQMPEIPDYSNDMVLCAYDNLTYDIDETQYIVTDEIVDAYIYNTLYTSITPQTITDQAIQNGDIVNLQINCVIDGSPVYWTDGSQYTLGQHTNSEIYDSHIIGQHIGDEVTFTYEYPSDYSDPTYAGKTAEYTITILSAQTKFIPLDDTFATTYTSYATITELRAAIRQDLEARAIELRKEDIYEQFILQIIERSTYNNIPGLDAFIEDLKASHNQSAASLGITNEQYYQTYLSLSASDYDASVSDFANKYLKTRMAICQIARLEGITVTQDEYDAYVANFLQQTGYTSLDQVSTTLDMHTEVLIDLLMPKVMEVLIAKNP